MVEDCLKWPESFFLTRLVANVQHQITVPSPIMVDDLNHLVVKVVVLSNGVWEPSSPILHFNDEGVIEVFEKKSGQEEKVFSLVEIVVVRYRRFVIFVIHANVPGKQKHFAVRSLKKRVEGDIPFATLRGEGTRNLAS